MKKQFFINLSNHISSKWSNEQREAALALGEKIIDIEFPNINPHASTDEVHELALKYLFDIRGIVTNQGCILHIAGEATFVTHMINLASIDAKPCVTATSERISKEEILADGTVRKTQDFKFVQWRRIDNLPAHF